MTLETSQFDMGWLNWLALINAVEREKEVSITAQQKKYNQMSRLTSERLLTFETSQSTWAG